MSHKSEFRANVTKVAFALTYDSFGGLATEIPVGFNDILGTGASIFSSLDGGLSGLTADVPTLFLFFPFQVSKLVLLGFGIEDEDMK